MDAVVIVGSFVIFSNELVSIIVRLVYPGILGRNWNGSEIFVQFVFEAVCASVCLVPYVSWHAIKEVRVSVNK